MKGKKIYITALILSIILTSCGGADVEQEEKAIERTAVEVTSISKGSIKSDLTYAGNINPTETVAVVSKMSGKVKEVYFDIGDKVSEGAVLFTLDESDIKDQIKQLQTQIAVAEQGVKTAQAALNTVTGGQYESQVLQIESSIENTKTQIDSAEVALKNAELALNNAMDGKQNVETSFNNTKMLYDTGIVSRSEFEKAELAYKQAQTGVEQAELAHSQAKLQYEQALKGLKTAEENLNLTKGQIVEENQERAMLSLEQAKASKNSASVQLEILQSTLNDTNVKSPIRGIISGKTAVKGEYTSPQLPAYTVVNMEKVNVQVKVSEVLINLLSVGQEVDVLIKTVNDEPIKGIIKTISPAADQTSTYPITIEINNADGNIKPGMFAEVHFTKDYRADTIVMPRNTVMEDETGSYVYIAEGEKVKKVYITTGIDNGEQIEIIEGLKEGDKIITKGQSFLTDGAYINVVEEANQ